ncbi:MAG: sigma-54 dependent transcriptional regulator [Prevotellaceae bacterium]|jgi:transcriptional regulator with PAS, ATPase and Fis domain|nr:sigma-54 dependent transcriptional regulator [Prevotellaceae bacterium]
MIDLQSIKQQFDVIGSSPLLDRGIDIACQVAPTDLSVLITGESGTGKEVFPKIIHKFSARKHGQYIAVNCGAIPDGTIDSELFGHEKGSFTGALDTRKGYFEVADGGTIFLDEVAELPLSTQVRLLRVLETGEFLKVGSSKVQKTNVRIIAATNVNLQEAIKHNRFREDLYYRLNTVPITVPPLRERKEDVYLLFRKFASDFAEKYRMPSIVLDSEARTELENYPWPGNIRQLKNVTEQISVIEHERNVVKEILCKYLPPVNNLPVLYKNKEDMKNYTSERELLYKILFDMRNDVNELKTWMYKLSKGEAPVREYKKFIDEDSPLVYNEDEDNAPINESFDNADMVQDLQSQEKEAIKKVLKKFNNKRKPAAEALGISERTLYRKIKEYDIEECEDDE